MTPSCPSRAAGARRRGALLLETALAVSIFAMAGLVILSLVNGSVDSLARSRDASAAVDLARSVMARLEAGLGTAQTLSGPVARWEEDESAWEGDAAAGPMAAFADVAPAPTRWEVEVETEPSEFDGLTLATVRAFKRAGENSDQLDADFTLRQLVRLGAEGADVAGEADAIGEAALRGAARQERFGPTPSPAVPRRGPRPGGRP